MTDDELRSFVATQRTLIVTTLGKDGWPHSIAMWYVVRDGEPWVFTYAKSQKVKNLERDRRATLLLESGWRYEELRGVMLRAEAEIHRDFDVVAEIAEQLFTRYADGEEGPGLEDSTREAVRARAAKRVAVQFHPTRTVSWDHAKLGGTY